jgi:hypothetical protein
MMVWMRAAVIIYALFFWSAAFSGPQPHCANAVHDWGGLGNARRWYRGRGLFAAFSFAISAFFDPDAAQ